MRIRWPGSSLSTSLGLKAPLAHDNRGLSGYAFCQIDFSLYSLRDLIFAFPPSAERYCKVFSVSSGKQRCNVTWP